MDCYFAILLSWRKPDSLIPVSVLFPELRRDVEILLILTIKLNNSSVVQTGGSDLDVQRGVGDRLSTQSAIISGTVGLCKAWLRTMVAPDVDGGVEVQCRVDWLIHIRYSYSPSQKPTQISLMDQAWNHENFSNSLGMKKLHLLWFSFTGV